MKTKIVEAECVVTIQYEEIHKYKLENTLHRTYFTDYANGGQDFVQITKLAKYEQRNDWQ